MSNTPKASATRRQIGSRDHEKIKEELNQALAEVLKELQIEKNLSADETFHSDNPHVQKLLCILEASFLHGLKVSNFEKRKNPNDLPNPQFWGLLKKIIHKDTVKQINDLKQIKTNIGRCRTWLRISLNQKDISSYLYSLITEKEYKSILKRFYENYSLFNDLEQADIFIRRIQLTADLDFEIGSNSSLLNIWTRTPLEFSGIIQTLDKKVSITTTSSTKRHKPNTLASFSSKKRLPQINSSLKYSTSSSSTSTSPGSISSKFSAKIEDVKTLQINEEDGVLHARHLSRKTRKRNQQCRSIDTSSVCSWESFQSVNPLLIRKTQNNRLEEQVEEVKQDNELAEFEDNKTASTSSIIEVSSSPKMITDLQIESGDDKMKDTNEMFRSTTSTITQQEDDPYAVDIYAENSEDESEVEVLSQLNHHESVKDEEILSTNCGNSLMFGSGWSSDHRQVVDEDTDVPEVEEKQEEKIFREGILLKKNSRILFPKTRWLVLTTHFIHCYKNSSTNSKPVESIELFEVQEIDKSQILKTNTFCLKTNDGINHFFSSSDKILLSDWINDIEVAMLKAKSATLNNSSSSNESDFDIIDNFDAINIENDGMLFTSNRMLLRSDQLLDCITKIACEKGLDAQNYQCAECTTPIGIIYEHPRICSFTGLAYCSMCHINDEIHIPARIIHNWDFRKQKVSKSSKEFLTRNWRLPCINLNHINPALYRHVTQLKNLLKLRSKLVMLFPYFKTCRFIKQSQLDNLLRGFHHMLKDEHIYSCHDLMLISNHSLEVEVENIVKFGSEHVRSCQLCSAKGFFCEICGSDEVIFSFEEETTYQCDQCHGLFHKKCFVNISKCPRCKRRNARFQKSHSKD